MANNSFCIYMQVQHLHEMFEVLPLLEAEATVEMLKATPHLITLSTTARNARTIDSLSTYCVAVFRFQ